MAISWDDDAVDGGKTSVQILVDWLITPGNYERWRKAGLTGPVTKTSLLEEMVPVFVQNGILHRSASNIGSKVFNLERSFDEAVDILKSSAVGSDGKPKNADKIARKCKYFDVLYPVMARFYPLNSTQSSSVRESIPKKTSARVKKTASAVKSDALSPSSSVTDKTQSLVNASGQIAEQGESLDADNALLANYQLVLYTGNPSEMISEASFVSTATSAPDTTASSATLETLPTHPLFSAAPVPELIPELNTAQLPELIPAQLPELIPAHVSIQKPLAVKKSLSVSRPSSKKSKSIARKVRSNAFPFPLIDAEDESDEISDTANDDNDEDWASPQFMLKDRKANKKRASIVNASTKQSKDGYKPGPASKSNRTPHSSSKRSLIASSEPHKKSRRSDTYTLPSTETKYRSRVSSGYERDEHTSQRFVEQDDLVLQIERQELKLRLEKIKSDIEIYKSDAIMTKIKARRRLKRSGVSDTQIDRLLPL
ncbi:hypothetical protein QVD99_005620 [Batrachochytrium dendrobatidis]|nr:hypothetical protein O5D80_001249 [Batrachochytrium dendrobatidis]KAK5667774.1 hypothetical protein QVD99_005620 [Batrachochytrium dendrobatidis]